MSESCDCQICGWHVRDIEPLTEADTWVTSDSGCLNSRPRADQYLDSRYRRRRARPTGERSHARRSGDIEQLTTAGDGALLELGPEAQP